MIWSPYFGAGWVLYSVGSSTVGVLIGRLLLLISAVGLMGWPTSRRWLRAAMVRSWTRRRFLIAVRRLAQPAQAVDVLGELGIEMDARYAVLLGEHRRKITEGYGMRLIVVAVNELAF